MKKANRFSVLILLLIAALALSTGLSVLSGLGYINLDSPFDNTANIIDNDNVAIASSGTTSSYGMFAENSQYTFTDKTKIASYRSSADGTGTDLTTITVKYTKSGSTVTNHGTQENPYVIDNFNSWKKFVSDMAQNANSTYTYGSGKYYVLAFDLNFNASGAPVDTPIYSFGGTLYGLGHTISNYSVSGTHIDAGLGLINNTPKNSPMVVITDLNVDNYTISNVNYRSGGIVGAPGAKENWFINCHSNGTMSTSNGGYIWIGGIVGCAQEGTATQNVSSYFYRCSAKFTVNATLTSNATTANDIIGGIMGSSGDAYTNQYFYDCYSDVNATVTFLNCAQWNLGGIIGYAVSSSSTANSGGVNVFSGCVSKVVANFTRSGTPNPIWTTSGLGALFVQPSNTAYTPVQTIENIYISGYISGGTAANTVKLLPWITWDKDGTKKTKVKATGDVYYSGPATSGGVFNFMTSGRSIGTLTSDSTVGLWSGRPGVLYGTETGDGESSLWGATKSATALKSKIWTQKNNIGEAYSIQNSPVINKLKTSAFNVNYYDAKSDGTNSTLRASNTYNSMATPTILSPTDTTGRKWLGYTLNRSGSANVFQSLTGNYYGDLDLYAVWDTDDDAVTKSISVSGGKDESGTQVADYGSSITLTANISMAAMSGGSTVEYEWRKAGSSTATFTGQQAVIRNIADSGTYNLYYKIKSTEYPLWGSADWRYAGQKSVRIDGLSVKLNTDTFTVTKAFIGMPMGSIEYTAEFLDSNNSPMTGGTVTWSGGSSAIIDGDSVEERGGKLYYKTSFTYTPSASNSNYKVTTFDNIEFEVKKPKIIFNMEGINTPIEIDAEYGRTYNADFVANAFETAFLANLTAGTDPAYGKVQNLVPCFTVGSQDIEIDTYRTSGPSTTVNGEAVISVKFKDKSYTVTFSYIDETGHTQTHTENSHKYGDLLDTTWLSLPAGWVIENNEWKFTDKDGTTRAWRFTADGDTPADRVTDTVTLSAKAVELNLVLQSLEITPRNAYTAQSAITSANITVIAHYYIDNDSSKKYDITLSLGDGNGTTFKAEVVGSPDGRLHVSYKDVKISHFYGGTKEETVSLNVTPIPVDTSGCGFEDVTVKYGANIASSLPKVRTIPDGIESVSYKYFRGINEISVDDIVGDPNRNVTYTVRATFTPENDDYSVSDLSVSFTISAAAEEVYLVWDTPTDLPYNGQVQYPKAKVFRVSDDSEITGITITYNGDNDKSVPGSYSVTVVLGAEYSIRLGDETCAFTIKQAVLPLPTFESGSMTFNGAPQSVILKDFDASCMTVSGMDSATDAGDYSVTVTLSDSNYIFVGGISSVDIDWSIEKAMLTVVWDMYKFEANGSVQHPNITRVDGFVAGDSFVATDFLLTGDDNVSEVGGYEITATILNSAAWARNYQLRNPKRVFAILPEGMGNVTLITVEWDNTSFKFNNAVQHPTYVIKDMDGNVLENVEITLGGDYNSSKWAGEYSATATAPNGYYVVQGKDCGYTIILNDAGEGTNPEENGGNNGGGGFIEKLEELINSGFPLWQICTIAAGALLTLIFMIKAIQYGNRKKKAKGEAKKISAKTYAALLPIFATEPALLFGLNNKIWSIIAFAMVGVTVLMFLTAIITRKGWKKAELAKEQAIEDSEKRKSEAEKQERRELQAQISQVGQGGAFADNSLFEQRLMEMEERHRQEMARRDEEQAKRDEAMKIMLANLMGRQQAGGDDMPYASMDDTDLLVQKVIAGLLPAVQQMMPEPTAYLAAPSEETEELKALVAEQSETMRNMADKIDDLQNQLADMSHNVLDAEIIPDNSEEIRALKEEHDAKLEEQNAQIEEQNAQIVDLQNRIDELMQGRVEAELLPDQSEEIKILTEQIEQLKSQIAENGAVVVNADNSEELRAMAEAHQKELDAVNDKMQAMSDEHFAEMQAMRSQLEALSSMSVDELDDEDFDDEEEWDSILDEDDDDFVEAVIMDDNGKERKVYPNFRMRLKQSSDKNREWYAVIKNLFCSQKGVTYRVYKRVEKIRYQGQVIAVIGIAKRSIKLWLALKPYEYDARRYHHKDVSDKPRFVDVPMYVRITSDRALDRSQELILALFQELNMEARKHYTDRPIQELIFTLKHNRLLTNKQNKQLLCETMHVHDCDVLDDETAEKCIEAKNVEFIDDSNIETVKLDDIDAKFQDGNRITLDRLKKEGLVSEDCTGYTVTADKRITKPLIIVANDFSLTAVKLITLTGGRAIRLQTV